MWKNFDLFFFVSCSKRKNPGVLFIQFCFPECLFFFFFFFSSCIIPPPSKKVRSSFSSFYLKTIPQLLLPHLKTYETPKKSINLSNVTPKKLN